MVEVMIGLVKVLGVESENIGRRRRRRRRRLTTFLLQTPQEKWGKGPGGFDNRNNGQVGG